MGRSNRSTNPTSLLNLPQGFFQDACVYGHGRLQEGAASDLSAMEDAAGAQGVEAEEGEGDGRAAHLTQWACGLCRSTFLSLQEQRSHCKTDFHRFNIKRKLAKKETMTEEEFEVLLQDSVEQDHDISSISGSEEEDNAAKVISQRAGRNMQADNHIAFFLPKSGNIISIWKCILVGDKEELMEKKALDLRYGGGVSCLTEEDILRRLESLVTETEKKQIWVFLLASGGHFAGCVFDVKTNSLLVHKTYHRYVVRAGAGGKQSTKDATGRVPKSAGATFRRYNEMALQKEIREVLVAWKNHIEAASCIFMHAPFSSGDAFFRGDDSPLDRHDNRIRHIPFTTRRPTLNEVKRVIHHLTTLNYREDISGVTENKEDNLGISHSDVLKHASTSYLVEAPITAEIVGESDCKTSVKTESGQLSNNVRPGTMVCSIGQPSTSGMGLLGLAIPTCSVSTPLHDAARSGNSTAVLELLKKGDNPCARDQRGLTAYAVAADKETRNVFRRFMAEHPELWDWHAANVPSPLTKDMEVAKSAKQAEKDAKRKSKAKELKKKRKAKEKSRAQTNVDQMIATGEASSMVVTHGDLPNNQSIKAQEKTDPILLKKALQKVEDLEREKRAAAAEKRISAMSIGASDAPQQPTSSQITSSILCDGTCSCCGSSLAGKDPFYRYSYKYCSIACVQIHRKAIDGIEHTWTRF